MESRRFLVHVDSRMATNEVAKIEEITPVMNNLELNGDLESEASTKSSGNPDNKWNIPLDEVYRLALRFYKGKNHLSSCQTLILTFVLFIDILSAHSLQLIVIHTPQLPANVYLIYETLQTPVERLSYMYMMYVLALCNG